MFQFRRFPTYTYLIQCTLHGYCPCGLPHSDIHGSTDICSSPWLFAACHVLLRLLMPRHSPCALSSLTNQKQIASFSLWIMQASQIVLWNCNRYPSIRCSTIKITSFCVWKDMESVKWLIVEQHPKGWRVKQLQFQNLWSLHNSQTRTSEKSWVFDWSSYKERKGNALASGAEEGRDKLR